MKRLTLIAVAALGGGACSSSDPSAVTRQLLTMSKEEAYAQGDALVAKKKYELGRQYLRFVAENYANDPLGKQAALRLADSYFEERSPLGFIEAQSRFKDFRSRYPSHPRSDYALFRLVRDGIAVANCAPVDPELMPSSRASLTMLSWSPSCPISNRPGLLPFARTMIR